jgi:hypothetical protein
VFIGDDGIVPYRREPDETAISNERYYMIDSLLRPGSPEFARIALGYNTTDDFYTDVDPISWQGRHLYVPDVPTGRMIETPVEIGAQAQAFVQSNGQLNIDTGFVSGYDFFTDGAQAMSNSLSGAVPTDLISDTWTADDLRCLFRTQRLRHLTDRGERALPLRRLGGWQQQHRVDDFLATASFLMGIGPGRWRSRWAATRLQRAGRDSEAAIWQASIAPTSHRRWRSSTGLVASTGRGETGDRRAKIDGDLCEAAWAA